MATHRLRDRSGSVLEVTSKDQADYWVGLGYVLVADGDDKKPARKAAAKKTAAKPSTK